MPRRKSKVTMPPTPTPSGDWWLDACRAFGWIPEYYTPQAQAQQSQQAITVGGVATAPVGAVSIQYEAELKEFCRRIVEALVPPGSGYSQMYVDAAKKIYDVAEDKLDIYSWFTEVRQLFGLRDIDLAHIIYKALQGFTSPEMVKLRDSWWEYLKMLMQSYGPIT